MHKLPRNAERRLGLVAFFYDDQRYKSRQMLSMRDTALVQTSVQSGDVVLARHTFMDAITVLDWNLRLRAGGTNTGTDVWKYAIGKSLGGTGTVAQMGTATIGTQADNTVKDAACAQTNFVSGDDIVFTLLEGTALIASEVGADADVMFEANFVA